MDRQTIIDDLAAFVTTNREDQLDPHESLYVEMLQQWRQLAKVTGMKPANQELADRYWAAMEAWHQRFNEQRSQITEPAAFPTYDLANYYHQLITELATAVMNDLPRPASTPVIQLNDFGRQLSLQMRGLTQLDLDMLAPLDCALLLEYWRLMNQVVKEGND